MSAILAEAQRRDLRSITSDGVFFSVMVGLGEAYVPAFALAVGFDEVVSGMVATLPMLAGAVFQLVTPSAVRHLRSYRRWVVSCACLQALSFTPLIAGALAGRIPAAVLWLSAIAYWSFGMATSPAWNAWVTALVPEPVRARFFASRTRAAQASLFVAIVGGGAVLELGRARGVGLVCFGLLFTLAMLARFVSAGFLARQSERSGTAATHRTLRPAAILAAVRRAGSLRVLAYLLGMQIVVNVAAPYFTPYMLGPLSLSYVEFMVLTSAAFLARALVLPGIGRIAESRGTRPILWWGALGIVPLPALWLLSHDFAYLLVLQIFAGGAWAALEYVTLMTFFEGIDEGERASVLAAFNLANAAAVTVGAVLGSRLFLFLDGPSSYAWLFALSTTGRLGMLLVLRGARPAEFVDMQLRALAVRPSAGAVERPILATVGAEELAEESAGR